MARRGPRFISSWTATACRCRTASRPPTPTTVRASSPWSPASRPSDPPADGRPNSTVTKATTTLTCVSDGVRGDLRVVLRGLGRAVSEPGLQLEQGHRFLGVVELAGDRGPGPVAGDVPADVGGRDAGLAAEHGDDRVVDVGRGYSPGPEAEQQVHLLGGPGVDERGLGWPDGLPGVDGLAEDRVDGLGDSSVRDWARVHVYADTRPSAMFRSLPSHRAVVGQSHVAGWAGTGRPTWTPLSSTEGCIQF